MSLGREVVLSAPPEEHNDINQWWTADSSALPGALGTLSASPFSIERLSLTGTAGPRPESHPEMSLAGMESP